MPRKAESRPEPMTLQQLRAAVARAARQHGADHPDALAVRAEYEFAYTAHIIQQRLAGTPPLSSSELDTLTALIQQHGTADAKQAKRRQVIPDSAVPLFELDTDRQETPDSEEGAA